MQHRKNKQESVQWLQVEMKALLKHWGIHSHDSSTDDRNCLIESERPTETLYLNIGSNKLGITES